MSQETPEHYPDMYYIFVENSVHGLAIVQDSKFVFVNQTIADMLGYSKEELLQQTTLSDIIHPDDIRQLSNTTETNKYEVRTVHKNGNIVWLEWITTQTSLQDQPAIKVTAIDISERKNTETNLSQSDIATKRFEDQLKILHEVSIELSKVENTRELFRQTVILGRGRLGFDRLGVFLMDADTNMMYGTFGTDDAGQIRDEYYFSSEISHNSMIIDALNNKDRTSVLQQVPLYDDGKVVGHGWNAMALLWDGANVIGWIAADNFLNQEPLYENQIQLLGLFGSTVGHLIKQKQTEEKLIYSEERFSKAFHANPSGISISTVEGKYVDVNDKWVEIFGYSHDEAIGRTGVELNVIESQETREHLVEQLMENGFLKDVELIGQTKTGNTIYTRASVEIVELNKQPYFLTMIEDITTRKEAEAQRLDLAVERERFTLLNEFIGNISHDLKTPLAAINFSLYLVENLTDPQQQKVEIDSIKKQVKILEKFIRDVLTISQLDHTPLPTFKLVNLSRIIKDIEKSLQSTIAKKNLTTELKLDPDMKPILSDEDSMYRVFSNLFENAVNYTPENGSIAIIAQNGIVEFQDTGMGIPQKDLPHIFERFYRSEQARSIEKGGTGLGLAIVKKILDIHGGHIEVESVLGQGSKFRIVLPQVPKLIH